MTIETNNPNISSPERPESPEGVDAFPDTVKEVFRENRKRAREEETQEVGQSYFSKKRKTGNMIPQEDSRVDIHPMNVASSERESCESTDFLPHLPQLSTAPTASEATSSNFSWRTGAGASTSRKSAECAQRIFHNSNSQKLQSQIENVDRMLVVSQSPENTARLLAIKGTLYQKLGKHEQAINLLNDSISLDPTPAFAYVRLGESYRLTGNFDQSIAIFEQVMERAENSAFLYSRYGAVLFDSNKDIEKAKSLISKSYELNRQDLTTLHYARKAGIYSELVMKSLSAPKKTVAIDPNILFRSGYKEYTQGNLSKAKAYLNQAIEQNSKHSQSLATRGEIFLAEGDYTKAKEDFEKAAALDSSQSSTLLGLANSYIMSGDQAKGLNTLEQVINRFPGMIIAHIMRGEEFRKLKRWSEAYDDFTHVIDTIESYIERMQNEAAELPTAYQGNFSAGAGLNVEEHKKNLAYAYGRRGMITYRLTPNETDAVNEDFEKALNINPNDTFVWSARGSLAFEKKQYESAKYYFQKCLKISSKHTHTLNNLGEIARIEKNYTKAKNYFKISVEINPKNAFAYERLGEIYRESNEHEKALMCLGKALDINPASHFALSCRGDIYRSISRLKEAFSDLNTALGIHKSAFTYANLGEVYRLGGGLENYYRALKAYEQAIHLDGTFSFAYFCKAKLYAAYEKHELALDDLDRSIQLDKDAGRPVNHLALLLRSNIHLSLENFDAAYQDLEAAHEAAGDQPIVYRYLTMYWYRRGNLHNALKSIETAISLDPSKALYHAEKAKIHLFLREYQGAKSSVEQALELDDTQPTALSVQGVLLSLDGKYDEAIVSLNQAITKEQSNGFSHSALGEIFRIRKEFTRAKEELNLGIRYSPKSPMPYLLRGILHFEVGDYPNALEDFDQYERNGHHYFAPLAKSKETLDILVRSMRLIIFLQTERQLYYSASSSDKYQEMLVELDDKVPDINLEIFRNIPDIVLTDEHKGQIQGYIESLIRLTDEDKNFYALSSLSILYLLLGDETKMKGTLNNAFNTLKLMPSSPRAMKDFQPVPMSLH